MDCKEAQLLSIPHIMGDLDVDSNQYHQLQTHLLFCPVCADEYDNNRWVVEFIEEHKALFAEVFESVDTEKATQHEAGNKRKSDRINSTQAYLDEDTRLMLRVATGDHLAYERLYKRYLRVVIDYIASLEGHRAPVEDLTQEVFARLWQNRRLFGTDSSVKTYMLAIAKNVLREQRRRIRHQVVIHRSFRAGCASNCSCEPGETLGQRELAEAIEWAKCELSDKQGQALELAVNSSISLAEAARQAGLSDSAFRQRLHDAKKHLVKLLGKFRPS